MCGCVRFIEFQSFQRRRPGERVSLRGWLQAEDAGITQGFSQPGVGVGLLWIKLDSPVEELHAPAHAPDSLLQEEISFQEGLMGVELHPARPRQNRLFLGGELNFDLPGDSTRDFALHDQNVGQVALVFFRPEVPVIAGADQLRGDPHPASGLHDCPFEDRVHVQLACYRRQ